MIKTGLILAAGKGSRMGQVDKHSKPMVQIAGKPLIGYAVDAMLFCGISRIYVIYSDNSKDILTLQNQYQGHRLFFVYQENVTGSLSSLAFGLSVVELPVIMMDADIIIRPNQLKQALDHYVYQGEDMAIAAVSSPTFSNKKTLHIRDGCPIGFCGNGYACPNAERDIYCQGGMIYLWFRSPAKELMGIEQKGMRRMSLFLNDYMTTHAVSALTIQDLWDVDTPADVSASIDILLNESIRK